MIDEDKVLALIEQKGPVVPTKITRDLKVDSFIVGAVLSNLVGKKKLILSHARIGGSPLYYLPTQREQLDRLRQHLNEKNRRAYDLLQERVVLLDETLDPLGRTCLREIKDFSVPFRVSYKGKEMLFFRWHLASPETVKQKIKELLKQLFPQVSHPEKAIESIQEKTTTIADDSLLEPTDYASQKEKGEVSGEDGTIGNTAADKNTAPSDYKTPLPNNNNNNTNHKEEKTQDKAETEKSNKKDTETIKETSKKTTSKPALTKEDTKQKEQQEVLDEDTEETIIEDAFYDEIALFLEKQNITITEAIVVKKNSDL
ncbi:MAG: hypothetical protein ACMXYK_01790, partial [Candidatus Woesearchaeota archaeon]